jgi:hypothetical protein
VKRGKIVCLVATHPSTVPRFVSETKIKIKIETIIGGESKKVNKIEIEKLKKVFRLNNKTKTNNLIAISSTKTKNTWQSAQ